MKAKKKPISDLVHRPAHYNSGKIEVIEAIEDWKLNYNRGNSIKYIARAGRKSKDTEIQDLEKAIWYCQREIELLRAAEQDREPLKPSEMGKTK